MITLWLGYDYIMIRLWLHYDYIMFTLWLHECYCFSRGGDPKGEKAPFRHVGAIIVPL